MNGARYRLVDTHAHLCAEDFDDDREAVLERAGRAGIAAVVAVGENLADARRNIDLATRHAILKPAAGLYPTVLDLDQADAMVAFIREHVSQLVAIGEVGLDYWVVKDTAGKALQREIFRRFVALSGELDLPLNVHSRSAGRHAIALLLESGARRVQLHAFDGKAGAALPAVDAGYYFSIPPSVIRSRQKQKLVRLLPLSSLLVETDSPVLGVDPLVRNEPANLLVVIDAIAQIKAVPAEAVIEAVVENSVRLYGDRLGG
ncbi:TatD family hydrolase [Desulfosarcina ovata]|uniref:Hydrolase TatD n=1 Tax=Desulfosarcina ovata subsp. ovata TaxID=2752305 RepID=A0A5K8AGT2_9BACT|nr:TatD family hydrolase [Desulfosarcina ovata]BBO91857.1 hydrolase TatD [Desulfosarcina ovata subsp. ovata]